MDTKRSKYDTNPLDPNFVKDVEVSEGQGGDGPATQPVKGPTRPVTPPPADKANEVYTEAPTRRYDKATLESSYPSVFVPPTYTAPPVTYQPTPMVPPQAPLLDRRRPVRGLGISEKWATMWPYVPYLGVVACILELFLVPRHEGKVRFHASQGLALHVALLVFQTAFNLLGAITNTGSGSVFKVFAFVFLIVSMIRVGRGKPHHIGPLAEPTKWFNEHIEARK